MKAIQIHAHGGPDVLKYEDVTLSAPGRGELRIRIKACSKPLLDPYPGDKNIPGIGNNKISKQICNKSFKNVMVNLEKLRNNNAMFYTIFKKNLEEKHKIYHLDQTKY